MSFLTKQDQVADILRERVIAGSYRRGDRLKQADIAEELGVSITPVREALHVLEAEGYVTGNSHRGLLVPEINAEQAGEIKRLRVLLETDLIRRALVHITPEKLACLRWLQNAVVEAAQQEDHISLRTANYRFHFGIYDMAKSPQTLQFVRILWAKYPFTLQEPGAPRFSAVVAEHEIVLAKIEKGDMVGAAEAMAHHIDAGWRHLPACAQT